MSVGPDELARLAPRLIPGRKSIRFLVFRSRQVMSGVESLSEPRRQEYEMLVRILR